MSKIDMLKFVDSIMGLDFFNFLGIIATFIGLFITFLVFIKVRKLNIEYLSRIRTPEILDKVKKSYLNISKYIYEIDASISDIKLELAKVKGNLASIKGKLPTHIKKSIYNLLKLIRKSIHPNIIDYILKNITKKSEKDIIFEIHNHIATLIEEIDNDIKDRPWRITP